MKRKLGDLAIIVKSKDSVEKIDRNKYVTTENMISNRGGVSFPSSTVPKQNKLDTFDKDDVLVSNIRPYFKKIWKAPFGGYKSGDVLAFRTKDRDILSQEYLYILLESDRFFEYMTTTAKGTKMPRGDKKAIAEFPFDLPSIDIQKKRSHQIEVIEQKISLNQQINANLQKLASTYFQFFLKKIETTNVLLEEVANIKSGGDKPKDITSKKDSDHLIPIFSNGMTNEGLYGYTKIAKIKEKAITVSARGTIGCTCLRTEPYFPIVRLISVIPYPKISVYYLYLWLLNTDIQGFGTTQQQLTVPVFKKYSVSIPKDLKDMSFFDNHVSVFFEQIQKNKEETKLLKEIKESLLKKLF